MDKKIKKYLCVDDIEELKAISWNKMRIVTPKIADKRIIAYRFKHMERVADISYQIMMKYMEEYKKSGKSYSSKKTKITKSDYHQLKEIEKNDIQTTVIFLALVHDIYNQFYYLYIQDKYNHLIFYQYQDLFCHTDNNNS